jgi:cell shape-determining protein MreD
MFKDSSPRPSFFECLASVFIGSFPLFLLFGLAAAFGANTVIFNGERVYGWIALLDAIILNIVYALLFAVLQKFGFLILDGLRGRRA